jgi:hypothetical protein
MMLQELCLELTGDLAAMRPLDIARSLRSALGDHLDEPCAEALSIRLPVTIPAGADEYPDHPLPNHPHPGSETGLRPVDTYAELFTYTNLARTERQSTPTEATDTDPPKRYYHCYIHTGDDAGCLPLPEDCLAGLQVAGAAVTAVVTQPIDLEAIDYTRLRAADTQWLEFCAAFVHDSSERGFVGTDLPAWIRGDAPLYWASMDVPIDDTVHELKTLVAGQRFTYDGTDPVATAKEGLRGVGLYTELGCGALRLRPADAPRITEQTP